MIKKTTLLLLLSISFFSLKAQEDTTKAWSFSGENKITLGSVALSNWAAGGANAMSGLISIDYKYNYKKDKTTWDNRLILMYGLNKQANQDFEKTEDRIDFTSAYGYQIDGSKWFYSFLMNFKTQFAEGYEDFSYQTEALNDNGDPFLDPSGNPYMVGATDTRLGSKFMAPGYLTLAPGAEFKSSENFKVNISPLAAKATFVLDDALSARGAYGVDAGSNSRWELGANIDGYWKQTFTDNFYMENNLRLFSNYLESFGNVDVDWVFKLNLVVSKYVTAEFVLNTLYDDDIKIDRMEDGVSKSGPVVQLKSTLGVGLVYVID